MTKHNALMRNFWQFCSRLSCASCSTIPTNTDQHPLDKWMTAERFCQTDGFFLSCGSSIDLGDLPLGMQVSPDGKFAAIVNSGEGTNHLDSRYPCTAHRPDVADSKSWMGVRFDGEGENWGLGRKRQRETLSIHLNTIPHRTSGTSSLANPFLRRISRLPI